MKETSIKIKRQSVKSKFSSYLNTFYVKKGEPNANNITNTRIGDKVLGIPGGSFHIPDEVYPKFLETYFNEVVSKGEKEYLTEKQLDGTGPILIDIDLRYEYGVTNHLHSQDHVSDLVCLCLDELNDLACFNLITTLTYTCMFLKKSLSIVWQRSRLQRMEFIWSLASKPTTLSRTVEIEVLPWLRKQVQRQFKSIVLL